MCDEVKVPKGTPKSHKGFKLKQGQHIIKSKYGAYYMIDENNPKGYWQCDVENGQTWGKEHWNVGKSSYRTVKEWVIAAFNEEKSGGCEYYVVASGGSLTAADEVPEIPAGFTLLPDNSGIVPIETPTTGGMTMKDFKRHAYVIRQSKPTLIRDGFGNYKAYDQGQLVAWQRMVHQTANLCAKLSSRNAKGKLAFDSELFLEMCGATVSTEAHTFTEVK